MRVRRSAAKYGKQSLESRVRCLESAQLTLGEPKRVERFGAAAGRARTRGLVAQRLLGGGDRALELAAPAGDDRLVEPATGELGGGRRRVLGVELDVGLGEKRLGPLGLFVGHGHRELTGRHGAQPWIGGLASELVRARQHLSPARAVGDLEVPAREQDEHVRLESRIVGEAPRDHLFGPREEIRLRNGESFGVGLGDQEAGKIVGDFGPAQLLERSVALCGRSPRLPPADPRGCEEGDDDQARRADLDAVARDELAHAIAETVGTCLYGEILQMAPQVVGERRDGRIALGDRLA